MVTIILISPYDSSEIALGVSKRIALMYKFEITFDLKVIAYFLTQML